MSKTMVTDSINIINFAKDGKIIAKNHDASIESIMRYKDQNIKVISIIGQARFGKSSLFNMIISRITNSNQVVFGTSSSDQHCTRGINIALCNGYLFMDCEGIQHHDSRNDIKLLLITYLLSDVIIFNDTLTINNSTLKSLEPMITLMHRLGDNIFNKPQLIFRVKDYYLDTSIDEVLQNTMKDQEDHYQNIRKALNVMFDSIDACATESIDKKNIKLLKSNKYMEFLGKDNEFDLIDRDDDFGFNATIDKIMQTLNSISRQRTIDNFFEHIGKIVEQINEDKGIKHDIFDTYTIYTRLEMTTFLDRIDKSVYEKLVHDPSEQYYNEIIKPKLDIIKKFQFEFNTKFNSVSPSIKDEFNKKIDIIKNPITDIIRENIEIGIKQVKKYFLNWKYLDNISFTQMIECIDCIDLIYNIDNLKEKLYNDEISNAQITIINKLQSFKMYKPIETIYEQRIEELFKIIYSTKKDELNQFIDGITSFDKYRLNYINERCSPDIYCINNISCVRDSVINDIICSFRNDNYCAKFDKTITTVNFDEYVKQFITDESNKISPIEKIESISLILQNRFNGILYNRDDNIVINYLNSHDMINVYYEKLNELITNKLETDEGCQEVLSKIKTIINNNSNKLNKFIVIRWIDINIMGNTYGNEKTYIYNDESKADNMIHEYITCCNSKFTPKLIKNLFCTNLLDELIELKIKINDPNSYENVLTFKTCCTIVDEIDKYYVNHNINRLM